MNNKTHQSSRPGARRGVSILEFFGCIAALGVGIVIGSLYLGVDVQAVAVKALEGETLASATPEDDPAETASETSGTPGDSQADEAEQGTPAGGDSTAEPAEASADEDQSDESAEDKASEAVVDRGATIACWNLLIAALDREAGSRTKKPDSAEGWQLFDYIVGRRDAHAEAVAALEELPSKNVDQRVLGFAERVEAWHQRGAELYGRAANLLTEGGSSDLGGAVAQSWQSAATQHRMEERLLIERRDTLARYLQRQNPAAE